MHVAVDLDGTLRSWENGDPINGASRAIRILSQSSDLILHTCRTQMPGGMEEIGRFLALPAFQKVEFQLWTGSGKPVAAAYVDDRAVSLRSAEDWPRATREVMWLLEHRPELGNEGRP